jgi:hypothetical protein
MFALREREARHQHVRAADGKARATVTPDGAPPAFFLRVKVK